jgi:hypothetical protein
MAGEDLPTPLPQAAQAPPGFVDQVRVGIGQALLESVGVPGSTELKLNVPYPVELDPGTIALDGDRDSGQSVLPQRSIHNVGYRREHVRHRHPGWRRIRLRTARGGVDAYKDGVVGRLYKGLQELVKSKNIESVEGRLVAKNVEVAGRQADPRTPNPERSPRRGRSGWEAARPRVMGSMRYRTVSSTAAPSSTSKAVTVQPYHEETSPHV